MPPADLRAQPVPALIRTVITSYAYGHQGAPRGNALRVDARRLHNPPEDPAVRAWMLQANGLDPHVRAYVLATPGADRLIERSFNRALVLLALPDPLRVDIHVLCGGGRHRSVVVAEELAALIRAVGYGVKTEHRHIDRPVLT
ncbi:RNase adapter RapZ [Streptomyces sp. NPDC005538]|uniref:RapZ C-terminal domain-containing protein n=1 Tax=Streptomyces sp. NPDC005538 TaxID=3157043 RepID=UPI0033B3FBF4